MSEKDSVHWRRKLMKLARKILNRANDIENLCIDDFLDEMNRSGSIDEEHNCLKAKALLTFLLSGIEERLDDIRLENLSKEMTR